MQLSLQGYGSIPGELRSAIIQPNNSVYMLMVINNKVQTSNGPVQITSNGTWTGTRNGSTLSGPIRNLAGNAQVCVVICFSADFTGQGHWYGSLTGSDGTGTLNGTITFTNSPVPQIQTGQPYLMSGTWNADFDLPVPEFAPPSPAYMITIFTLATILLMLTLRPRNRSPRDSSWR